MRKQLLVVLLPLLVVVSGAQTVTTGLDKTKHATLQRVLVVRADDGINVEMTALGPVKPEVSPLESPARVLVTLPNTVAATSRNYLSVGRDGVKGVRIGMDQNPPTTRVVIDLLQACTYEITSGGENKLVVKLHPVAREAETAKPATAPAATSETTAAATAAPSHTENSSPQDFVFIEPSYKPTQTSQAVAPVVAPPARAVDAAAKFVERPEGNLLPPSSAAPQSQEGSQAPSTAIQPAVNLAAQQKAQAQEPPKREPLYTGEPISVNLKDVDLQDFFRLIHEISGLNVVLDPNVKGTLTIVLDDVPWDQALDIVLKNNGLARQLDGNVLRIATIETLRREADAHRAQREAEALAVDKITFTRFLSYAHAKDLVPTCKKFISQRGDVIADERTNAIIVNDVPSVMPALDKLLTQLDTKTQQVEI
jgi:type IV pilus assembly protein PilQ